MFVVCLFCLWRQFYFCHGTSDGFLHHIMFFLYHSSLLWFFSCSSDQCLFGIHDLGAWSSLLGLLQNQGNFIGKFQLVYSLWPQHSIKKNENQLFKYFNSNISVSHKRDQINRYCTPWSIQVKVTTVILQWVSPLIFFYIQSVSPTEVRNQMFSRGSPK